MYARLGYWVRTKLFHGTLEPGGRRLGFRLWRQHDGGDYRAIAPIFVEMLRELRALHEPSGALHMITASAEAEGVARAGRG